MGTINVIHYVLKTDYQDRDGNWIRHLSATYDGIERRVTTRLGSLWNNILQRTKEGGKYQISKPSYTGTVNLFSSFDDFCDFCINCQGFGMVDGSGKPYALDKDIVGDGKTYSREKCCFVPLSINNLLLEKGGKKSSELPSGITVHGKKYRVRDGSSPNQYLFTNLEDAIKKKASLRKSRIRNSLPIVAYDERIVKALKIKYLEEL